MLGRHPICAAHAASQEISMQRGKRTALVAALAGLLAAGISGLAVSQSSADDQSAPSGRVLILVPHPAMPGAGTTDDDGNMAAPGANDDNATGNDDDDATGGDQAPQSDDGAGTPRRRILILVPVPQGSEQAAPDEDQDDNSNTAPGQDDASTPNGGRTLILVPRPDPHALPPGILEA
jgi:hypothetical protein